MSWINPSEYPAPPIWTTTIIGLPLRQLTETEQLQATIVCLQTEIRDLRESIERLNERVASALDRD